MKTAEKIQRGKFQKQLFEAFCAYDTDMNGVLDKVELRRFLDDIRYELNLTKTDNSVLNKIWHILDNDRSGSVDAKEFIDNMEQVLLLVSECGIEMEILIKKVFADFDIDSSGFLERPEFKLFLNLMCDKLQVKRSTDWQIDYQFSLFDDDNDGRIDMKEFSGNYRIIYQELINNKSLSKKEAKKNHSHLLTKHFVNKEKMSSFMDDLVKYIRECQKTVRQKEKEKILSKKRNSILALDIINNFGIEQGKELMPLEKLIETNNIRKDSAPK